MDDFNIDELLSGTNLVEVESVNKPPIPKLRVFGCIMVGLLVSFSIFVTVTAVYTKYIRYPAQEEIVYEATGACALDKYEDLVHSQEVIEDSYLLKEIEYANSNDIRLEFIKEVVNSIDYQPLSVTAKNIYGNDMVVRVDDTDVVATIDSPVFEGEEVRFSYIDYKEISSNFDKDLLQLKIDEYGLTKDNVVYSSVLVDMFCDYIVSMGSVPIKTEHRAPNIVNTGSSYSVTNDEDIYLDTLLFSSEEFNLCKEKFTEEVGKLVVGEDFKVTDEWLTWSKLSTYKKESTTEPYKYGKYSMLDDWCGAYVLQNSDDSMNVSPNLGDGTFDSPASLYTPVISYVLVETDEGDVKELPIEVELVEFGVSEDALIWFQSKHYKNRGFNLESEVQYYYSVFNIVNLSDEVVTVNDNSAICDENGNTSSRTGNIFGLASSVELQPGENGYIESWGRSTELYKKYLIWGADFKKTLSPQWFRVLAGDIEDTSWDKGVHIINKERTGTDTDTSYDDVN